MKKHLFLISAILLGCGCASFSLTHMHGKANGSYIWNGVPVVGNMDIDNWHYIGFRMVNMTEVVNATTDSRPSDNSIR